MSSKIFISCVTEEFGELRKRLRHYLTAAGCHVQTQEDFPQQDVDILEKLDAFITSCAAVIHIVGHQLGSTANTAAVARYLKPDVLAGHQQLRETLGDFADLTYTQWEAFIAIHHHRPLRLYHLPNAQPNHLARLKLGLPQRYGSKFRDDADLFGQLIGDLREIIPSIPPRFISNIPGSIGDNFKGRDTFLTELRERLTQSRSTRAAAITAPQAIHGLGGIGKTRVAIEYAHRYSANYAVRLFVQADNLEDLWRNFANLTAPDLLNLPEYDEPNELARTSAVHHWLNTHPGWLLILDNVDTEAAAIAVEGLLPKLTSGHVLITSRLSNWSAQVSACDLDVLKEEDAIAFLLHRTSSKRAHRTTDAEDVKTLASKLDGLALALEQAAAYISERRISFAEYVRRFDEQIVAVLKWHNPRTMQYPRSVAVTWQASYEQLSEAAKLLLEILSLFASTPIPRSLFSESRKFHNWESALAELFSFSLVRSVDDTAQDFSVHRLVQEVTFHGLEDSACRNRWSRAAELIIPWLKHGGDEFETWPKWIALAPHCEKVINIGDQWGHPYPAPWILDGYSRYIRSKSGDYQLALQLARKAVDSAVNEHGPQHPNTLTLKANLAGALKDVGEYAQAEALYVDIIKVKQAEGNSRYSDGAPLWNNFAALLLVMGKPRDALQMLRSVLRVLQHNAPNDTHFILRVKCNLGEALRALREFDEAETLLREVVEGRTQLLDRSHPELLVAKNNLALVLSDSGRLAEAIALQKQILDDISLTHSEDHPYRIKSLVNYASSLRDSGELTLANELLMDAERLAVQKLGPDHSFTQQIRNMIHPEN